MNHRKSQWTEAILEKAATKDSFLVKARTGCGKSTNLQLISHQLIDLGNPQIFIAFNKHNANALKGLIPASCSTIHSLGAKLLREYYGNITVLPDKSATLHKKLKLPGRVIAFQQAWELFRLLGHSYDNDFDGWAEVNDMVEDDVSVYEDYTEELINLDLQMVEQGELDFTDMVWSIPFLIDDNQVSDWGTRLLMLDECQDASGAALNFLEHVLDERTQFIGVGDDLQSIFGWAGAGKNNFPHLQKLFNTESPLLLPLTYRCPEEITNIAQEYCPDIQWHKQGGHVGALPIPPIYYEPGALVIGRTYGELIPEFFPRKLSGENVALRGSKFMESTCRAVLSARRNKRNRNLGYSEVIENLKHDKEQKLLRLPHTLGAQERRRKLSNEVAALNGFLEYFETYEEMYKFATNVDSPKPGTVVFSSIHRCKGDGNDNVYFLGYSEQRDNALKAQDFEALKTTYVGVTRSSSNLYLIN